jgi:flagellar biosynthesis protein FlhF
MRIKLFTASGMPQAIAQIRDELGADAVILGSRRVAGGVEVTAAREEATPAPPVIPRDCPLSGHGTPEQLAIKLRSGPLPFALAVVLRFQPFDAAALTRGLLFIGPPGAGKTLTVARLAARLVLAGGRPRVVTADTRRAAAFEQLAAYTDLMGLPLHHIAELPLGSGPLLVDTPGLDPFDPADRSEISALSTHTGALPVLVLPGGIDATEATDLADAFADVGAARLVATRLDIARRLGGILAAAAILPLAEAGIGAAAPAGLVPMTPELLAARLNRRHA